MEPRADPQVDLGWEPPGLGTVPAIAGLGPGLELQDPGVGHPRRGGEDK